MTFNGTKIIFLENKDFKNGVLCYNGKPVSGKWVVMVWGSYCGFCLRSKDDFKNLAKSRKDIVCANIQIDGSESEQALGKMLTSITGQHLSGVPAYLLFEDGKFSAMIMGGKKEAELIEFISS